MIGKKLTELRIKNGMTQVQAAKKLKMPRSTYSNYELDKREPDFETAEKIASFYGITVDELLGRVIKESSIVETEREKENREISDLIIHIKDPIKKEQAISYLRFLANSPTDGAKK